MGANPEGREEEEGKGGQEEERLQKTTQEEEEKQKEEKVQGAREGSDTAENVLLKELVRQAYEEEAQEQKASRRPTIPWSQQKFSAQHQPPKRGPSKEQAVNGFFLCRSLLV